MNLFLMIALALTGRISQWEHYTHFGAVNDVLENDGTVMMATTGGVAFGTIGSGTVVWDSTWTCPGEISNSDARCLALDASGNLWVGTNGGGIDVHLASGGFQHYGQLEGLPLSLQINCILPDTVLWAGTTEGLCSRELGYFNTWTVFSTNGGLPSDMINCIAPVDSGLFVGTSAGLVMLRAGQLPSQASSWYSFDSLATMNIKDILIKGDTVWVASGSGLFSMAGDSAFTKVESYPLSPPSPTSLDWMDGKLAVGDNSAVAILSDSTWESGSGNLGAEVVQDIKWLSGDSLLIGTYDDYSVGRACGEGLGLGYIDSWSRYQPQGAPSNDLRCLSVDSAGDVWVTTNSRGAGVLHQGSWTIFRSELPSISQVFACAADRSGGVFIAPYHHGVTWIDWKGTPNKSDDVVLDFNTSNSDILNDQIMEIKVSADGYVWFAHEPYFQTPSEPSGVSRLSWIPGQSETASWRGFQPTDGLPSGSVRSVEPSPDPDEAWMGTQEGLVLGNIRNGSVAQSYSTQNGLPSNDVQALARSRDGRIYIGTTSGMAVLDEETGTLSEVDEIKGITGMLCVDNLSSVWATGEDGLYRIYPDGSIEEYNTFNSPLQSLEIRFADVDTEHGYLYLATDHGLWKLTLEQGMSGSLSSATLYPNPFLPGEDKVLGVAGMPDDPFQFQVFDLNGGLVYESQSQNRDDFSWNGDDSSGNAVATGIYFVVITQDGQERILKLAVVR